MESSAPKGSEEVGLEALSPKLRELVERAEKSVHANNHDYTINLLQAVLKEEPKYLHGRKMLREAAIRKKEGQGKRFSFGGGGLGVSSMKVQSLVKKDPLAAIVEIEKNILAQDPFNPHGNQLLFEAASKAALPMTAGYALEILVQGNDDNTKFKHQLGDYYMDRGFFLDAARVYSLIVIKDSSDLNALKKEKDAAARASMAAQKDNFRDNLRDGELTANLEAESRSGMTSEQRDRLIEQHLTKYGEDQNDLATVKTLADLYEQKEDFAQALAFYEWAHTLSGGDLTLQKRVTDMRDLQRKQELSSLAAWLEGNKDHPEFQATQERYVEMSRGHYATQVEELRKQVDQNPTDQSLRFKLGETLLAAGMEKEAIPELQRAQSSPSLRLESMTLLGRCYERRGMHDLAVNQLQKVVDEMADGSMNEQRKEAIYTLGLVHEKMGNQEQHLECMKQIYAADYSYLDVAERVESSYS